MVLQSISPFRSFNSYFIYLVNLMLGTCIFKLWCLLGESTYFNMQWPSLSLLIISELSSIFSSVNSYFFSLLDPICEECIFSQILYFQSICMKNLCLLEKWDSYRQEIFESCFYTHSVIPCIFIGELILFTFR